VSNTTRRTGLLAALVLALAAGAFLLIGRSSPADAAGGSGSEAAADARAAEGAEGDATQQPPYAFVDVAVLPMDSEGVVEAHTVIVSDGLIESMGPAGDHPVPDDAVVIEGSGRFLMPGLAEMHAHVPPTQSGWPSREALEDIMFLYLANGVTTIRGMLGAPYQLELREELARMEMLGPTFYVGAPSLNGNTAPNPDAAERLVRAHAEAGYDLQKIHPGLSMATWDRMDDVADEVGLTYGGHVPQAVGLRHALETGISTVDHLDGYVNAVAAPEIRERLMAGESVGLGQVVGSATPERIAEIVEATRAAGTWMVPTMYLWENLFGNPDVDRMLALPEMQYVSPQQREGWRRQASGRGSPPADVIESHNQLRRDILEALSDGGVGILMGTDSPQMFNVPGFALHREIRVMSEAGMSNWAVLESGTVNVARYAALELGEPANFGVVAPGNRADLVLLNANPLDDLANLADRAGVMVKGHWLPASEIEAGLAALAAKHGA